jgi:hypothetical protein
MQPIAHVQFTDGMRPVYEDFEGQFVCDDEGKQFYGVWYIPPESLDQNGARFETK